MTDLYVQGLSPALQQGVILVERGEFDQAWRTFAQYLTQEPSSAIASSYLGMLMAVKAGKTYEGLDRCLEALKRDPQEALIFLNLSRCYLAAGDRYQAVRALHKGLKLKSPHNGMLVNFYKAMGMRRRPVVKFLHRDNPLNIFLGKLSWKWKGRETHFRNTSIRPPRKGP